MQHETMQSPQNQQPLTKSAQHLAHPQIRTGTFKRNNKYLGISKIDEKIARMLIINKTNGVMMRPSWNSSVEMIVIMNLQKNNYYHLISKSMHNRGWLPGASKAQKIQHQKQLKSMISFYRDNVNTVFLCIACKLIKTYRIYLHVLVFFPFQLKRRFSTCEIFLLMADQQTHFSLLMYL